MTLYALLIGLYSAIPAVKEATAFRDFGDLPSSMHAAFTLFLGVLLVFRTNAAYARWWEARTLWGALVNVSRNLAVKVNMLIQVDSEELSSVRKMMLRFPRLLRDHLRRKSVEPDDEFLTPDVACLPHVPSELVERMYQIFGRWKQSGKIDGESLRLLDLESRELLNICGGCERIRNTRIVRSYRIFARQCVLLYLLTFPWGIADDFNWWTIPMTTIIAYFMLGLETVAEHVEEPFGLDEDDLDLDGLCNTITASVSQIFERREQLEQAAVDRSFAAPVHV